MSEINKFETAEDVQRLYEEQTIPRLDELTQIAIKQFLTENNCENIGGALVFDDKNPKTREAKLMAHRYMTDKQDDTFYGPAILDGKYYAAGIGIWALGAVDSLDT